MENDQTTKYVLDKYWIKNTDVFQSCEVLAKLLLRPKSGVVDIWLICRFVT